MSDDGGCDTEEHGHESLAALEGAAEPAASAATGTTAPLEGTMRLCGLARLGATPPQRRRTSSRMAGRVGRGGRARPRASTGDLLLCCDDALARILSNLDAADVFMVAETCRRLSAVVAARTNPFWQLQLLTKYAFEDEVARPRLLHQALQFGMEAGTPPFYEQDAVGRDVVKAWWRCKVMRLWGPRVLVLYDGYELPEWRYASVLRVAPVRVPVTEVAVLSKGVLEVSYATQALCPPSWWEAVVVCVYHRDRKVKVSWKGDAMFEGEVATFPLILKGRPFSPLLRVALPEVDGRLADAQRMWTQYITDHSSM